MKNNKKTKIMIIIILVIIIIIIYNKFIMQNDEITIENIAEEQENKTEILQENNSTTEENIVIYITGEIKKEGIYELPENSRIADAIEKAGGINEQADLTQINLAYKLQDGMRIYIPKKAELNQENNIKTEDKTETIITKGNTKETENTQTNKKININKATQAELETLPGIGTSTAEKIIKYRTENGNFKKKEDIMNVSGIGENKYQKIKDLINV